MADDWLDFQFEDESEGEKMGAFFCPYTNCAQCALLTKGWQPQELCRDLECEQMKWFEHSKKRKDAAA